MAKPNPIRAVAEPRNPSAFNKGNYKGLSMSKVAMRPNALVMLSKPSRIGDVLFYPNGDTVKTTKE